MPERSFSLAADPFRVHAQNDPGADAVIEEHRTLSRAELSQLADRIAHVLTAAGITSGRRVAWMMANRAEVIALAVAVQRLGAVFVPIGYRSTPREVAGMLEVARPDVVVCDRGTEAKLSEAPAVQVIDIDSREFAAALRSAGADPVQ